MKITTLIDRREALRKTVIILGGAVSAPTMMGILNGCSVTNDPDWVPQYFDNDQAVLITEISDIIIPATDTPGARDVGVPKFIESMVKDVFNQEDQSKFMEGLNAFNAQAMEEYNKSFIKLKPGEKKEFVKVRHEEALKNRMEDQFIMTVKEMTISGFCTSEAGATQVLKYDKVPGEYEGCIPFADVGKQWAT